MDKFQNKYRIPSARLQTWDYGRQAAYFFTICTWQRKHYFGKIVGAGEEAQLEPTSIGSIAGQEWMKTTGIRPDMNLELDAFIVMPNHIHGIIIIGDNPYNSEEQEKDQDDRRRDAMHRVSTGIIRKNESPANYFGPQSKNLASILRGYKSSVTAQARNLGLEFGWQARYHDHIIRDLVEFERIQQYIFKNPSKWEDDDFYS